jgi:MerR family glutamine synthetase transcriptional repressor
MWERESLIRPFRTDTNNRLYSDSDFRRLAEIHQLTQQGVNLAGIRAILGTVADQRESVASSSEQTNDRK